jgi:hypothetical protein
MRGFGFFAVYPASTAPFERDGGWIIILREFLLQERELAGTSIKQA